MSFGTLENLDTTLKRSPRRSRETLSDKSLITSFETIFNLLPTQYENENIKIVK